MRGRILSHISGPNYHALDLSRVIFVSHDLKDKALKRGFSVDDASVVHWGVRPQLKEEASEGRKSAVLRFVFAGRLIPEKGCHTLVEAFASFLQRQPRPDVFLDIYGRGEKDSSYVVKLHELAGPWRGQEKINFCGWVTRKRLRQLLPGYDVFVFPSQWDEPFSIVLLEAMASGVAILATKTGGTPEAIDDNCALFFEAGDVAGLHNCILRAYSSPSRIRELARNAQIRAADFSLASMVDKIENCLWHWHQRDMS